MNGHRNFCTTFFSTNILVSTGKLKRITYVYFCIIGWRIFLCLYREFILVTCINLQFIYRNRVRKDSILLALMLLWVCGQQTDSKKVVSEYYPPFTGKIMAVIIYHWKENVLLSRTCYSHLYLNARKKCRFFLDRNFSTSLVESTEKFKPINHICNISLDREFFVE